MVGKNFDDPEVQADLKYWSFNLGKNEEKRPVFKYIDRDNNQRQILPEQVTATILQKMKRAAQDKVGHGRKD